MSAQSPENAEPAGFIEAYAELQGISAKMRPVQGQIPDVDAIEPLLKRVNVLSNYCNGRIDAVRRLIGEQVAE